MLGHQWIVSRLVIAAKAVSGTQWEAAWRGLSMKKSCVWAFLLAWVLWTRTQGPATDGWTGASGFQNQEKCMANMKEKLDLYRQFRDAKFAGNAVTFTENKTTMSFYCLPESEDPRRKPATKRPGGTGEQQQEPPPSK
jgi:hypothetical protein